MLKRARVKDLVFDSVHLEISLYVDIGRKIVLARTSKVFREKVFALNSCMAARRVMLEEALPREIHVVREENFHGRYRYLIANKDLEAWLEKIMSSIISSV